MQADKSLEQILPYLRKDRNFSEYVTDCKRYGIDLCDELLDRARDQEQVNFFDLGCGFGLASQDIFPELTKRAKIRKLPTDVVDRITYYGIDKYYTPEGERTAQVHFVTSDLRFFQQESLPPIDVGLSYFVFPYLDRKLEALSGWYHHLRDGGRIIITNFYQDQLRQISGKFLASSKPIPLCALFIDKNVVEERKDTLLVSKSENPMQNPEFVTSRDETTLWTGKGPKGSRAGQKISFYRAA